MFKTKYDGLLSTFNCKVTFAEMRSKNHFQI